MKRPWIPALLLSAVVSSCGQTGSTPAPMPPVNADYDAAAPEAQSLSTLAVTMTTAKIVVRVPSNAMAAKSASVSVNNATPVIANLATGASGCVAATSTQPLTCTVQVAAPATFDTFTIKTYSAASGTGTVISAATILQQVPSTGATIPVTLSGTVTALSVQLGRTAASECAPAISTPVYVRAKDSLGNIIVTANYGTTITLHDSDLTRATLLSTATLTSSSTPVTLSYNGHKIGPAATITASASGVAAASSTPATLNMLQQLYVLDANNQYVQVFSPSATGNVAPLRILNERGRITSQARQISVSASCVLYAADGGNNSIFAFPAASSGAIAPIATITGAATMLNAPQGVAIGSDTRIYAPVYNSTLRLGGVGIWNAGSNGNVAPVATIMGSNTQIGHPANLAFDGSGNLYVLDFRKVAVFAKGAAGNVAPLRVLLTPNLYCISGMDVDRRGTIYVVDCSNTINVYAPGASGSAAPVRVINTGASTGPAGVGIAYNGAIFTALQRVPAVTSYASTASGAATPLTKITGSSTTLNFPFDETL